MGRQVERRGLRRSPETVHVLLVDDEPGFAELAGEFLEEEKEALSIATETNARGGLKQLRETDIDAIVSDYNMPGMDGLEFLQAVRETYPDLPFILFTGKGSEAIASEAISAGVTDYLQKDTGTEQYALLANRLTNAVEKYRAEQETRQAYKAIETAQEGISVLDEDHHFTYMNEAYADLYGYTPDELFGEHWNRIYAEEDLPELETEILPTVYEEGYWRGETHGVRKDGTTIIKDNVLSIIDDGGLVCAVRDITERKEQERAVQALHEATRELVDAETRTDIAKIATATASDVLGLDVNGVFLYDRDVEGLAPTAVTETARELIGTPPTFELGEGLAWQVFETGKPQIHQDIHQSDDVYNPDTPIRSEMLLPLGDIGVFILGSPTVDAFSEPDITLAKILAANVEAVLDRAQREQTLRTERDRFAALFEMIPEPVVHAEFVADSCIVRNVNSAFEETFGVEANVVGESLNDLIVPADRLEEAETIDDRARAGEALTRNVRRLTTDGLRDFLFRSAPIDEEGTEQFGIYIDITDQKERERKLARQTERLDQFASVVSHDLRNPLTVAEGRLQLARQTGDQAHLEQADEALTRMDALIEDLLTLARHGQMVEEPEPVDLGVIANRAWAVVASNEQKAELHIVADEMTVSADPERLRQALENLFKNAIEHAGPDVIVEIGPLNDSEGFYIEDDGPGIPPGENKRIFERGYSTSDDGTGFGLSIVQEIVDAHGWTVEVTDSTAGGARFTITGAMTDDS